MSVTPDSVVAWLRSAADSVAREREHLTELDAAIGDADHGANMDRGLKAVVAKLPDPPPADVGALLGLAGMTLVSTVGGASGALYGTMFLELARASAGKATLSPEEWAAALERGLEGLVARGKAQRGDKTMVDALSPAVEALQAALAAGRPFPDALGAAARAARQGALATVPLVARKGRASYLGERSAGHQDPGATSAALLLEAAAATLAGGA